MDAEVRGVQISSDREDRAPNHGSVSFVCGAEGSAQRLENPERCQSGDNGNPATELKDGKGNGNSNGDDIQAGSITARSRAHPFAEILAEPRDLTLAGKRRQRVLRQIEALNFELEQLDDEDQDQ